MAAENWRIFTDEVRKLAEAVRRGDAKDPHHIAETLKDCANTIDELDRRINMEDAYLAGLGQGRLEHFEEVFNEYRAFRESLRR